MRALIAILVLLPAAAQNAPRPFDGRNFHGRIAWSADGNHNDEDDWAASAFALALFAQFGVKDKLAHFDYNSILTANDPAWAAEHAQSVQGAIARYGYSPAVFHDSQRDLPAAIASLTRAINSSSARDPLYLVVAGPMELAHRAILAAAPGKRRFVHVVSHSRWNDGFDLKYQYRVNKRAVIATGVHWIQIRDQNAYLSTSPFGRPASESEWRPWLWLRDSSDANLQFLFQRLRATTRADCSDAGMAWFLLTGDEESHIEKLRPVLEGGPRPAPLHPRRQIRIEAENFQTLKNFEVDYRNDRAVSHRISLRQSRPGAARMATRMQELYASPAARYTVAVRYLAGPGARLTLHVAGKPHAASWTAPGPEAVWRTHELPAVAIAQGAGIAVSVAGEPVSLDYIELTLAP
jgi:hypothetical protein